MKKYLTTYVVAAPRISYIRFCVHYPQHSKNSLGSTIRFHADEVDDDDIDHAGHAQLPENVFSHFFPLKFRLIFVFDNLQFLYGHRWNQSLV